MGGNSMNRKESTRYVVASERQKATWGRTNGFARYVFYSDSIACPTRVLGARHATIATRIFNNKIETRTVYFFRRKNVCDGRPAIAGTRKNALIISWLCRKYNRLGNSRPLLHPHSPLRTLWPVQRRLSWRPVEYKSRRSWRRCRSLVRL